MFNRKQPRVPHALRRIKCLLSCSFLSLLVGCNFLQLKPDDEITDPLAKMPATPAETVIEEPLPIIAMAEPVIVEVPEVLDLWDIMRGGFTLSTEHHARIGKFENWYAKHQGYINRVTKRSRPYWRHIVHRMQEENMPLELALLPVLETAFDPFAYSHARASGMWQFLSGTASDYGLEQNWWYDGRRDVVASTDAAILYLKHLHKIFDGDWLLALAAYNTGQGNLNKAIRRNRKAGKPTDFWSLKLPRETRAYVPQLLALSHIIADPEKYNITLPALSDAPYFARVDTLSQIDLAQAATLAGISIDELYLLNPGFNRWATDPKGPHRLFIPIDRVQQFNTGLQAIPADERIRWERYKIKRGDSLIRIAKKYNTSVESLKITNQLKSSRIRAGKTLLIPIASAPNSHYVYSIPERIRQRQSQSKGAKGSRRIDYVVKSGDSFWRIARQHKVSVKSLTRWNSMSPKDTLKPGRKLVIWSKGSPQAAAPNRASNGVVRQLSYKVRRGDSLARIASKFKVRISDITRWNSVSEKGYIHPGQLLKLFVDVTQAN